MIKINQRTTLILVGIGILLLSIGSPMLSYYLKFGSPEFSKNFKDWSDFGSYFNSVSSPIIAIFNLAFFVWITLKVSDLQQEFTVHQMRNEAYRNLLTSCNVFCAEYLVAVDPGKKLYLITTFENQVNWYPDRMKHLFRFETNDTQITQLKFDLGALKRNMQAIIENPKDSLVVNDPILFNQTILMADEFLNKMQMMVLSKIKK